MNRLIIYRPLDILAEVEFLRREAEGWIIGAAPRRFLLLLIRRYSGITSSRRAQQPL